MILYFILLKTTIESNQILELRITVRGSPAATIFNKIAQSQNADRCNRLLGQRLFLFIFYIAQKIKHDFIEFSRFLHVGHMSNSWYDDFSDVWNLLF